jgi:THO complex subunit 4
MTDSNQPKSQPKSAAIVKNSANGSKGAAARKGGANPRARRAGRSARPAKKSQAELDTEMADYFNANSGTTETGATAGTTTAAGDAQMDDEVE